MTEELQDKLFRVVTHRRFRRLESVHKQDDPLRALGYFITLDPSPMPGSYRIGKQGSLEAVLDEAISVLEEFTS